MSKAIINLSRRPSRLTLRSEDCASRERGKGRAGRRHGLFLSSRLDRRAVLKGAKQPQRSVYSLRLWIIQSDHVSFRWRREPRNGYTSSTSARKMSLLIDVAKPPGARNPTARRLVRWLSNEQTGTGTGHGSGRTTFPTIKSRQSRSIRAGGRHQDDRRARQGSRPQSGRATR